MDQVDPGREAPARPSAAAVTPFVLVALIAFGTALAPPYAALGWQPLAALVLLVASVGFEVVAIRRPTRTWVDPVGAWLFFGTVALLRDATGGSASGLAPLVALPILWLALFGTRSDLAVATVLTFLTFLLPTLVLDPQAYPSTDWRRAVLWTALATLIAPVVHGVVRQLATRTARERQVTARLRGVLEGATLSSLVTTDVEGRITSFSRGAEQLLGYRSDQVTGLAEYAALHDPDEVAAVAAELGVEPGFPVFAELARRHSPSRMWSVLRADDQRLFVRLAITELRDDDGGPLGYLAIAIDGTGAHEAQRALAESEQRWRLVTEHLPGVSVLVVDEEERVALVAGAGARSISTGAVGRPLGELSGPEDLQVLRPAIRSALGGEQARVELRATATGAEQEVFVAPLPDAGDGGRRVLLLVRDVSADRTRQRELATARDRAQQLFTKAPLGIAVAAPDGILRQVNPALCALLGRDAEELVGRRLLDLATPGDDTMAIHLALLRSDPTQQVHTEWTAERPGNAPAHLGVSSTVLPEQGELLLHVTDLSERHAHEQELARLAEHDELTGLANRRRFTADLTRHLAWCERYGHRGALLLVDLDHFKAVNDTLGHAAGDELLVAVAETLTGTVRRTDLVGRLGGDEFAVLLAEADDDRAEEVAQHVVDRIRQRLRTLGGPRRQVTASVGVALVDDGWSSAEELLAAADLTMYEAKDRGDRWVTAAPLTGLQTERSGDRRSWSARLLSAAVHDEFELHLQPLWDLASQRVVGAEALVRLRDPSGLIAPHRFLGMAERTGLVREIDAWVVDHAAQLLAGLQRQDPEFGLGVNLSGTSVGDPALERILVEALARHRADPRGLVLEITETGAVADLRAARAFADRVTSLGCQLALDDFGVGFGSLAYLKHLPFAYLKIDGAFVSECHRSDTDRVIVSSAVDLAHRLGLRAVAEHVSDAEMLDAVVAEGVDLVQGYLVGRAVPYDEFVRLHGPAMRAVTPGSP